MERCVNATLLKSKGGERGNGVDARDFPALALGDEQSEDGLIQRKRTFPMGRCTSNHSSLKTGSCSLSVFKLING